MKEFYSKKVVYFFGVNNVSLSTNGVEDLSTEPYIEIEETRKNGQEDTHMSGCLVKENDKWNWEDKMYNMFSEYEGQ